MGRGVDQDCLRTRFEVVVTAFRYDVSMEFSLKFRLMKSKGTHSLYLVPKSLVLSKRPDVSVLAVEVCII